MRSSPTIEYSVGTRVTSLAAGNRHDFTQFTIDLPETGSRAIRNAWVVVHFRGTETSGTSVTSVLIGIKLGAVAFDDATLTSTLTHSGDQQAHPFTRDVTSYFQANFGSGTSQTCQIGVQVGGLGVINIAAKVCIQYEFDETDASADTRVKTVRIPIESGVASLTNSLAEVGTWQIPALRPNWQTISSVTNATDTISLTAHGYADGMAVVLKSSGAVPSPLVAGTTYYVRDATGNPNSFKLAATRGGSAVNLTDDGSGTIEVSADFMLPEGSVSVKQQFLEIVANEGHLSGTTDDALETQIDSATATTYGSLEEALDSSPWMCVHEILSSDTQLAHAFKARGTTTGRLPQLGAVLVVTYLYDEPSTTEVLNSVLVGIGPSIGAMHGSTSTDLQRHRTEVQIQEPGPIVLRQSGVELSWNHSLQNPLQGLNVRAGAQAFRAYTPANITGSPAGQHTLIQRLDADGAQGASQALVRGANVVDVDVYRTSTAAQSAGYGVSGRLLLNYRSGKAPGGTCDHNRTLLLLAHSTAAIGALNVGDTAASAPALPESLYWVTAMGYELILQHASIRGAVVVSAERLSGEREADGWEDVYSLFLGGTNELATYTAWFDASRHFERHPDEPQDRLAIEGSRKHRFSSPIDNASAHSGWASLVRMLTIHSIYRTETSQVQSSVFDVDAATVDIRRAGTNEWMAQATTDSSGIFDYVSYDDTVPVVADVETADGGAGRSLAAAV